MVVDDPSGFVIVSRVSFLPFTIVVEIDLPAVLPIFIPPGDIIDGIPIPMNPPPIISANGSRLLCEGAPNGSPKNGSPANGSLLKNGSLKNPEDDLIWAKS